MEGISGVVTSAQVNMNEGKEYTRFCKIMTKELISCIEGCKDAGAINIVVSDSHGYGENILIEDLPKDVKLVRGLTRPLMMMQGIEAEKFDGCIFLGYHASANREGILAHTIKSILFTEVKLNDVSASESVLNAALASHFRVPVLLISGDNLLQEELRNHPAFKNTEFAIVKQAHGIGSATCLTPEAAGELIRQKSKAVVHRVIQQKSQHQLDQSVVFQFPSKPFVNITFKQQLHAQLLSYLPIVQRVGAYEIQYAASDMVEIMKFLRFITKYNCDA